MDDKLRVLIDEATKVLKAAYPLLIILTIFCVIMLILIAFNVLTVLPAMMGK